MRLDVKKVILGLVLVIGGSVFTLTLQGIVFKISNKSSYFEHNQIPVRLANYVPGANGGLPDFTESAAKSIHSVVHIKTQYQQKNNIYDNYYGGNNPMLDFFFGRPNQQVQQAPIMAFGSGVIISADGYIVTNNHVVQDADVIEVTLNDKRIYNAKIIGNDPTTDLALIKIEENNLSFLTYGNSDELKIGEWVLAVGNPFNLTSTVTAGIISAKARNINIIGKEGAIESFIQTDAAVNPGNSGGALVNTNGQLVGVNAAIASNTGSYSGYSFAIPVNIVKKVVDDLLKYGEVQRAFLGLSISNIDKDLADRKSLKTMQGVYVSGIVEKGGAKESGIKEGDIITKVIGNNVTSTAELLEVVAQHSPGETIDITFIRDNKEETVKVSLKNADGTTNIIRQAEKSVVSLLGATFETPSKNEMSRLGIRNGLKITKLENGKFMRVGIRESFIITNIDRKPINTVEDIKSALETKRGGGALIEGVYPNGLRYFYGFGL